MIRWRAYAKINLALEVRGLRPDGFHEIESWVQTIDLADAIAVDVHEGAICVENDLDLRGGRDLAEVAAEAVLGAKGCALGAEIQIHKGIPAGAGLGGGSSDAAAVLHAVDHLTPPELSEKTLLTLAAGIGSDVPLFLTGGRLAMRGRGEQIDRSSNAASETYVLLLPPVSCDTRCVYQAWDELETTGSEPLVLGRNALRVPALAVYPELAKYDEAIQALGEGFGLYAGMSGSGSAFYVACPSVEEADAVAGSLGQAFPEARVRRCAPTRVGHEMVEEGRRENCD